MGNSVSSLPDNLYCFWTSDNAMSEVRERSLKSLSNTGLKVIFVDGFNLSEFISSNDLHPAYKYLSAVHKSDYLRCHFMHHYGGGYCDVKPVFDSWLPSFEELKEGGAYCVGYREVSRHGVANVYSSFKQVNRAKGLAVAKAYLKWRWLQINFRKMIGNGAFIFRSNTVITQEWWDEVNLRLDMLLPQLKKNPASAPKERVGQVVSGGVSEYPVPWSYIMGDVLHPLILKHSEFVLNSLPRPMLSDYE